MVTCIYGRIYSHAHVNVYTLYMYVCMSVVHLSDCPVGAS